MPAARNSERLKVLVTELYEKKYSLLAEEVEEDFQRWFDDPVDPEPYPDVDHPNHSIGMRRVGIFEKLSDAFKFGFIGAVFLGTIVALFAEFLSYWEMYNNNWPVPIVFIALAVVIGFFGGMSIGLPTKLRS